MIVNLDKLSADFAQKILNLKGEKVEKGKIVPPKNIERICASALGVLQEQGFYACILFLLSKSGYEKEQKSLSIDEFIACGVVTHLINMLNTNELKETGCSFANDWNTNPARVNNCKSELLKHISDVIAVDLKKLLMVKSLCEQALVYARYGAKALDSSEENP